MTEYSKLLQRLYTLPLFQPKKNDLKVIRSLWERLGKPMANVPVIHITGKRNNNVLHTVLPLLERYQWERVCSS